jgi:hypothetical protein
LIKPLSIFESGFLIQIRGGWVIRVKIEFSQFTLKVLFYAYGIGMNVRIYLPAALEELQETWW